MQDIKERAGDFIVNEMRDALIKIKELQEREARLIAEKEYLLDFIQRVYGNRSGAEATLKSLGLE